MSVIVTNLNKFYGRYQALKNISFSINKGDILGFIGPNGAGKTTTMKILSTILSPSSGDVLINDINIAKYPSKVKQYIGYLPENNPLYTDFYVNEALYFIAKLRKRDINNARINSILEQTGLANVKRKKIKNLSKGYKQRLGIAQGIVHNPDILILDEPSSGLDPLQIIEIRKLIKNIATNKAVLISTHIMQEVEAICNKIMVINQGEIIAKESISNKKILSENIFKIEFSKDLNINDLQLFLDIQNSANIKKFNSTTFIIKTTNDIRSLLTQFANKSNAYIVHLSLENRPIEEIFTNISKA